MNRAIFALAALGLMAAPAAAQEVNVLGPLMTFTLSGGAVLGGGANNTFINFPSQQVGTATITGISLVHGEAYTLTANGQDSAQATVHFGFIPGVGGFLGPMPLDWDVDFSGFGNPPIFTTSFVFVGTTANNYIFEIKNNCGPDNCEAKVEGVEVLTTNPTGVAVPGPVAGTALPVLLAWGGWALWRRRNSRVS